MLQEDVVPTGRTITRERIVSPWVGEDWQHLIITDVDNTLFDFGLYAEAGLESMLPLACSLLHLTIDEAISEVRDAFRLFNSIEIPYAYESLASLKPLAFEDRHRISLQLASEFWRGGRAVMAPYPEVVSTMAHVWQNGVAIVAVTDAPILEVCRKLRQLGVFKYIAGIVGVGSLVRRRHVTLRPEDIPDYFKPYRTKTRFYRRLNYDDRKPSPQAYRHVLDEIPMPSSRVAVVGDSPLKDLLPARQLGLQAYWAAYGERNRHLEKLLKIVTPFEPPEAVRSQADVARSFGKLDSFGDLVDIVNLPQLRFPLTP